ncbi:hypothetical protein ACQ1ZI_19480, partial [Enterococcus faecalis]|uniref:hypothetical protein n=1 Tax=Enterococcus faecalis TaxID=1351 RepID=UPI003D6B009D
TLLKDNGKGQSQVHLGILKVTVSEEDMTPVAPQKDAKPRVTTVRSAASSHVGTLLDLRGKRYERALTEVDQNIDAA